MRELDIIEKPPDFCARLVETFVAKVDVYNEKAVIYYNISNKKRGSHTDPKVRIRPIEWEPCRR